MCVDYQLCHFREASGCTQIPLIPLPSLPCACQDATGHEAAKDYTSGSTDQWGKGQVTEEWDTNK